MSVEEGVFITTDGMAQYAALWAVGGLAVGLLVRRWWCLWIVVVLWAALVGPSLRFADGYGAELALAFAGLLTVFLAAGLVAAAAGVALGRRIRPPQRA